MKKILVGMAFFCFLFFTKGAVNVQAAVMDVSDNFLSLSVDKKGSWFNDDFVHVQAKFNDRKQVFTANSMMKITWENARDAYLQGIKESGNLIIQDEVGKDHEVGQYVVNKDGVVVLFNEEVKNFENVAGQIDFDLQVKNKSNRGQNLIIQAGDATKILHVTSQNQPIEEIGSVTIDGNYDQDSISWVINIDPDETKYDQIEVQNTIPEGQILDEKSLKVKVAGHEIKLDKDNFQINENKLKLILNNKKDQGPISVSYDTQIKDSAALSAINQVVVRYQLDDGKTINENTYGEKIQNQTFINIFGKIIEKPVDEKKENLTKKEDTKSTKSLLDQLVALISERKKQNTEKENEEENKKQKQNQNQSKDLKLTSTPVTGLTGFDNKPAAVSTPKVAKAKNSDNGFKTIEDEVLADDDLKEASLKKKNRHSSRNSSDSLPKAGESATIILSITGLFMLIMGALTLGLKKEK